MEKVTQILLILTPPPTDGREGGRCMCLVGMLERMGLGRGSYP